VGQGSRAGQIKARQKPKAPVAEVAISRAAPALEVEVEEEEVWAPPVQDWRSFGGPSSYATSAAHPRPSEERAEAARIVRDEALYMACLSLSSCTSFHVV
jgi:hypothetical protein